MKRIYGFLIFVISLVLNPGQADAQYALRVNAGYLAPSGKYADKSFKENSGMADNGLGYSLEFSKTYKIGLGWSLAFGRHTNQLAFGGAEEMAMDEFGGQWDISGDPWTYYFVMPGVYYRFSTMVDVEIGVWSGYVHSVSPELRADYTISGQSDQLKLDESKSEALALMPSLRIGYPFHDWTVFARWSAFLARPQFNVTLLDGEQYDVKQHIINMNLGLGLGYRF